MPTSANCPKNPNAVCADVGIRAPILPLSQQPLVSWQGRTTRRGEDTAPYRFVASISFLAMDLPNRKRLPHEIPQWVDEGSFFSITINCASRGPNQLCRAGLGDAVLQAAAFYHSHFKWHCRLLVLMADHLYGIIAFPREPGMKTTVNDWKKYLARKHGVEWQRDFFDHRLTESPRIGRENQLCPDEPGAVGTVRTREDWPWIFRPDDRLAATW